MKWFAILALIVVLPIYGQEKGPKPQSYKNHAQNLISPKSNSGSAGVVINEETTYTQSDRPADQPKSYFSRLFSPENLPNIGLFFAGVIGIYFAVGNLNAIREQTEATKIAAQAAEKSVRLQEVTMRQWVNTDGWDINRFSNVTNMKQIPLEIRFDVINQTRMPLTLQKIRFTATGEKPSEINAKYLLAPDGEYEVKIPIVVTGKYLEQWKRSELTVSIRGTIGYIDSFENPREDPFGCVCICGPQGGQFSEYMGTPDQEGAQN